MKRLFLILIIITFSSFSSLAKTINIQPQNPNCKDGEKAACFESCMTTALYCGPFGTFDKEGNFIKGSYEDCNTTTCSWNCICVPEPKEFK